MSEVERCVRDDKIEMKASNQLDLCGTRRARTGRRSAEEQRDVVGVIT